MTDNGEVPQLLESLIRMVGRANQTVDSLQKRVTQLEWVIRELQYEDQKSKQFPHVR